MQSLPNYGRPPGPIAKILAFLVSVAVAVGVFMLSMVAFAVLLVLGLIAGVFFWWKTRPLRREIKRQMGEMERNMPPSSSAGQGDVIEGEYIREVPEDRK